MWYGILAGCVVGLITALGVHYLTISREKLKEKRAKKEHNKRIKESLLSELEYNDNILKGINSKASLQNTHHVNEVLCNRLKIMYEYGNLSDIANEELSKKLIRLYHLMETLKNNLPITAETIQQELTDCISKLKVL